MAQLFVGIDDGFSETKIVAGGQCIRIPSQAKAGEVKEVALEGDANSVFSYKSSDGVYSVGALREFDSTQFDDYPKSAMNRVIVAHAIRTAGIPADAKLIIASGLPLKSYYKGDKPNVTYIKEKQANLVRNDIVAMDGTALPEILDHQVISEGIAAWMDIVIQRDEDGKLAKNKDLYNKRIAIIDIGGRTTDIAVIQASRLDVERCATINVGMLAIREIVAEAIRERFDLQPTDEMLNSALDKKVIRLWGEDKPVADMFADAKKTVANRIESECKRRLGTAADIDEVVFVGGTVEELGSLINGWFRNQRVGDNPAFANASGMQKYAEYVMGAR